MIDARSVQPVLAYGILRRYPVRSRDHARMKPQPCTCETLHGHCYAVDCRCSNHVGEIGS